jgi:TRAP-type C4-dicarboxylate transport system substrate-binding protein
MTPIQLLIVEGIWAELDPEPQRVIEEALALAERRGWEMAREAAKNEIDCFGDSEMAEAVYALLTFPVGEGGDS